MFSSFYKCNIVTNNTYFSNFENIRKKLDYFKNKKLNIKFKGFDTTFVVKKNTRKLVGTLKNNNTNVCDIVKVKIPYNTNVLINECQNMGISLRLITKENPTYEKLNIESENIEFVVQDSDKRNLIAQRSKDKKGHKFILKSKILFN